MRIGPVIVYKYEFVVCVRNILDKNYNGFVIPWLELEIR